VSNRLAPAFSRRERIPRVGSNLARTLGAVKVTRPAVPLGVRRVLVTIAEESGLKKWTISVYKVFRGRRDSGKEIAQRRIFALTGAIGGRFSEGGSVVSIIATTERDQIVHLRVFIAVN
jgi:hypothetical protein